MPFITVRAFTETDQCYIAVPAKVFRRIARYLFCDASGHWYSEEPALMLQLPGTFRLVL